MSTFQKIDKDSTNAITNALSIFDIPSTNVSVSGSSFREYLTLNPLSDIPYHFKIHASTNYLDLSKCYVFMECRIRKKNADGDLVNLEATDNVSVCQLIGNTIWKNCRIHINGTQVFEGNSLMAYKSIFDYELTYPKTTKDSYLTAAGYYQDGEDSQTQGDGFNARKELFNLSRTAQFISKLDVDICNQPRYIVNQCEIDIELLPNDSNFVVIAPTAATSLHFEITGLKLYVKTLELVDSLSYDINKKLELKPARYPLRKSSIKAMYIGEDQREYNGCLWFDQIPRRVVLAMVANADYIGARATSPFNFQHFNVRDISIIANGTNHPSAPYSLDFPNKKYARIFHDTMEAIGYAGSIESNGISMKRYANGWCFFVFNLTASKEDNGDTFDLIKPGSCLIKISFSAAVPDGGIILVAMGEIDSLLMLDRNRTISTDITV
jgi:hypothetical protein